MSTLVAALIGVVGTYVVSTGNNTPAAAPAPVPPPTSATPAPDDEPTADDKPAVDTAPTADAAATPVQEEPTTAAPTGPPPGTVRWQGVLVIPYGGDRDLDLAPPVDTESGGDRDFAVYPFGDLKLSPDNGAKAMVWKGEANPPSYEDCLGVVDTQATGAEIRLRTGLAVCGRTTEGRLVLLVAKELAGQASDANATFDVVVWNS
ncbi:hypothetical protein [Streptomyces sp. CC208A]|uniref:hypothetical protein n=1 Tax=Streptomyces sp. CC208A TaxID=3044573 RepID=UPI0024A90022|nr:hypothetical protein [Streptomyces sp. CC208A]